MPKLDLVIGNNNFLTTPCQEWDFEHPPREAQQFAKDLIEAMYEYNGIGLAANQVQVPYRVFTMRGEKEGGTFVCFNPRIVHFSEEVILLEESCLSYPGLIVKVKRPRHIRMRFATPSGEVVTQQFTGMTARVVQHEMDHLDGILFFNRANKYYRDLGFKHRGKNVKRNKETFSPFPFTDF